MGGTASFCHSARNSVVGNPDAFDEAGAGDILIWVAAEHDEIAPVAGFEGTDLALTEFCRSQIRISRILGNNSTGGKFSLQCVIIHVYLTVAG